MRGRIQEEDQSAPQRSKGWFSYDRTLGGKQYEVHCRRKVPIDAGPPSATPWMQLALRRSFWMRTRRLRGKGWIDPERCGGTSWGRGQERTSCNNLLLIHAWSIGTSDTHLPAAEAPEGELNGIIPRRKNVEYGVHHRQNQMSIAIYDEQRFNSELLVTPLSDPTQTQEATSFRP
ncbi:hypothetical protein WJX74_007831 [Apatococcus lobatus]|uniref:Uncharacterized protein n=1 Tax=Apatococcus lobatus TaxID=904363 RepID=A0AAW1RBY5_9CHLO